MSIAVVFAPDSFTSLDLPSSALVVVPEGPSVMARAPPTPRLNSAIHVGSHSVGHTRTQTREATMRETPMTPIFGRTRSVPRSNFWLGGVEGKHEVGQVYTQVLYNDNEARVVLKMHANPGSVSLHRIAAVSAPHGAP